MGTQEPTGRHCPEGAEIDPEAMKAGLPGVAVTNEMIRAGLAMDARCSRRFDLDEMKVRAIYTAMKLVEPGASLKARLSDNGRFYYCG